MSTSPGGNKQGRHTEHLNSDQLRKIPPTLDHRRRLLHDYKIGGKKRRMGQVGLLKQSLQKLHS